MSRGANKTMIGAFVLGAIALAIAGVLMFGSGKFFKTTRAFDMYFEGSVQGLEVGSPVMFRGVKIGSVTDISLEFRPSELVFYIPVTAEIEPEKAKMMGPGGGKMAGQFLKPLIDRGLRAQLQTTSIVTGQLAVALDMFPNKPARYLGEKKGNPEIPTVPSTFSQLTKTIQDLPIQELFVKLDSSLEAINQLVRSDAAQASMQSLNEAIVQAKTLMKNLDSRIGPLMASLKSTSNGINDAVATLHGALRGDNGLPIQVQQTLEATRKTLAQAEQTLSSVEAVTQENSSMGYELGTAIAEMSKSMRSLRSLSDYLERHPEAIIRGKKAS